MSFDLASLVREEAGSAWDKSIYRDEGYLNGYEEGFHNAIKSLQDGSIPLKSIARPIEELKGGEGYCLFFKDTFFKAPLLCHGNILWAKSILENELLLSGFTHFLLIGGE